jgi:hypothetical protein
VAVETVGGVMVASLEVTDRCLVFVCQGEGGAPCHGGHCRRCGSALRAMPASLSVGCWPEKGGGSGQAQGRGQERARGASGARRGWPKEGEGRKKEWKKRKEEKKRKGEKEKKKEK